ncbi:MAG TPA: hypothetical protein VFI72_00350, partial [Candidatus Angelobacter sp.]|nr:hypothetical protein [Candidatus Angelobacter sp.]
MISQRTTLAAHALHYPAMKVFLLAAALLSFAAANARAQSPLRVNGARINQHLQELSKFGRNPQGGVSRIAYSQADLEGREYAIGLMKAA